MDLQATLGRGTFSRGYRQSVAINGYGSVVDRNRDGRIFLDIVQEGLRSVLSQELSGDALLRVFESTDTNAGGVLDRHEIDHKFLAMGYRAEDIQMFWRSANRNGDNTLSHQVPRLIPVPGFNVRQVAHTRLAEFLAAFKMNARNRSP